MFPQDRSFVLGKAGQHAEHCAAAACRRVQALLVQIKPNASGMNVAKEADQIGKTAFDAIDRPQNRRVWRAPRT